MELKRRTLTRQRISALGFNRTFMELKRAWHISFLRCEESFNRTFMELKHYAAQTAAAYGSALIGPLWN